MSGFAPTRSRRWIRKLLRRRNLGGFTLNLNSPRLAAMSVQPIQPQPFFADKNRAFWNLQSVGWAGAFLLRGSSTIANGQPLSSLIPVMISTVSGYSVTLLIAVIFRFLQRQRPIITCGASFKSPGPDRPVENERKIVQAGAGPDTCRQLELGYKTKQDRMVR